MTLEWNEEAEVHLVQSTYLMCRSDVVCISTLLDLMEFQTNRMAESIRLLRALNRSRIRREKQEVEEEESKRALRLGLDLDAQ